MEVEQLIKSSRKFVCTYPYLCTCHLKHYKKKKKPKTKLDPWKKKRKKKKIWGLRSTNILGLCVWVWVWLIIKLKVKTESSKTRLKPCESHSWKIRNSLRPIPSLWRDLEREKTKMSGGIARGRLAEERKAWRKNHPHVRSLSLSLSLFIFILNPSIFFFLTFCLYFYIFV